MQVGLISIDLKRWPPSNQPCILFKKSGCKSHVRHIMKVLIHMPVFLCFLFLFFVFSLFLEILCLCRTLFQFYTSMCNVECVKLLKPIKTDVTIKELSWLFNKFLFKLKWNVGFNCHPRLLSMSLHN